MLVDRVGEVGLDARLVAFFVFFGIQIDYGTRTLLFFFLRCYRNQEMENIIYKKWENDFSAIDEMGITFVDTMYSKAYLRHLFVSKELLGKQIASIHNLEKKMKKF